MEHTVIAEEVLDKVDHALRQGFHWAAYNNTLYFIDKDDIYFFKGKGEAIEFSENNNSDKDRFHVIHISSIQDMLRKVPSWEEPGSRPEISEEHMQCMDWKQIYYDPMEGNTDAESIENIATFTRLEKLIVDLRQCYHSGEVGKKFVEQFTTKYRKGHPIEEQKQFLLHTKTKVMNEKNLEYLKDNIKYMGFGEGLNSQLEENLKLEKENFQLGFRAEINKKPFTAALNFRKSDSTDMYFFNSFHASLQKGNGEKTEQTFFLNNGKGITAKEAYNLLDGRAVQKELTNKDNEPYKAWVQLDFQNKDKNNNFEVKQFHENYGYDLKAAVSKYPVVELNDPEKEKSLMQSLQKGNIQSVTIEKNGLAEKMFMEANPQFKSVTLYDGQMKRVQKESLEQYKSVSQAQSNGQEKKTDLKNEVKQSVNGDMDGAKKKSSRKKGMSV